MRLVLSFYFGFDIISGLGQCLSQRSLARIDSRDLALKLGTHTLVSAVRELWRDHAKIIFATLYIMQAQYLCAVRMALADVWLPCQKAPSRTHFR